MGSITGEPIPATHFKVFSQQLFSNLPDEKDF